MTFAGMEVVLPEKILAGYQVLVHKNQVVSR